MTVASHTSSTELENRVAVVTGATSGIGAAVARRLAAGGANVALLGRRKDRLETVAAAIGPSALPVVVDVRDPVAVGVAAASVRAAFGPVDLVVANAGVMLAGPYESADVGEWDQMVRTNIDGLLHTGRAFIDDLIAAAARQRPADLVHIGSIGGHIVVPTYAVYAATKAAVAHLTRTLRAELGPRGVRVKNVEPGLVATELGDGMLDAGARQWLADWKQRLAPLPPEDIADAVAYAVAAPARMNLAELVVLPTRQG